jgi:hypothetical protein
MYGLGARRVDPELKQIVFEASRALALLDAERLEELLRACQALNRDHLNRDQLERAERARQARDAAGGMAVFARVLDATRGNLRVIERLRALRMGAAWYESAPQTASWETRHGND